jgi:hypothetical protein
MRGDRSSFMPQLPDDAKLIFCHKQQIQDEILTDIEKRFATKKPIKMVIFGDWGVGKTHLTYHIEWWLKQHSADYPAFPVLIEIGDIEKKSRFDEIVRPFLERLGLEFLIQLVHDYRGVEPNVAKGLKDRGISPGIAEAFNKILLSSPGQPPVQMVSETFEYLKGRKVAGASLGLGPTIEESQHFVDVLTAVGEMYRKVHSGDRILFIADEAAKLESVESDDSTKSHWVNANKLIFGDGNQSFGFIYTISGKQKKDLPLAIWDPQLQNRLGPSVFSLNTLAVPDVEVYLAGLCDEFIDWAKVDKLVASGAIPAAQFDRSTYPFTVEGRANFIDYFNRSQQDSKPRDISQWMDDLAFLALKKNQRIITTDILDLKGI